MHVGLLEEGNPEQVPASAVDATQKHTYVPSNAQPAKKPARGPSVTPEKAYTDPAWLKYRDSRMNAYATSSTPTVAKMNASGTARPISPAGAVADERHRRGRRHDRDRERDRLPELKLAAQPSGRLVLDRVTSRGGQCEPLLFEDGVR